MSLPSSVPDRISPMLAVSAEPFDSPDHLFEIKWDGLRCLAFLNKETRLQSRNLRDISSQYPELASLNKDLRLQGTILDGEIITLMNGRPSFFSLQKRMHARTERAIKEGLRENPVIYVVFDLLFLKGVSLLATPFWRRRELLGQIVTPHQYLLLSEAIPEKGRVFFSEVTKKGLEGTVGKERNSLYYPGRRSPLWKKSRSTKSSHFVICGFTTNPYGRQDLSSLALGAYQGEKLFSFGLVGTGISQAEIEYLLRLLLPKRVELPPPLLSSEHFLKKVSWVRPDLVCEVEYLEVTPDRHLRHPLYRGLRPEVSPLDCRVEDMVVPQPEQAGASEEMRQRRKR